MKNAILYPLLFITFFSYAQVGIGTTTPDVSAALDLTSTTQGFLPPRLTTVQRDNIASSATGLVIYNTTTNTLEYKTASGWVSYKDMPDGTAVGTMNYWDGTNWVNISPGANGEVLKFVNNAPVWGMVEATVPDAPTIVSAVAGTGQATITFNAPAFNGYSTITSYTATSSPDNISVPISQSGDGTITVSGLTNGTSYTFTITATNALGTSVDSTASEAVIPGTIPDAPIIDFVDVFNNEALIQFNAPANDGGSPITSYTAISSPEGLTGIVSQSDSGMIMVTGLSSLTTYTFTITATNAFGTSQPSFNSNSITTDVGAPNAPTIGSAIFGNGEATISFNAPVNDGGSPITNYTATSSPEGLTGTLSQSGDGTITVTGLSNGTSYTFTITATNNFGTSQPSSNSNTITTPNGIPNAPTISSAVAGNVEATIYFNAPSNNGGLPITSYTATSSPEGLTGTVSQSGNGSIMVTGLTNGTSYTFTITATNALGTSFDSTDSEAVIPGTIPDAPTIVSAVAGNGEATISFTAPVFNGYSTITTYTATSSPDNISGTVSQSGDGTITVTGLNSLTSYTFTITATNVFGTSQPSSNSNTITTPNGIPNAPTISSAVAGNGEATIYFNAPANDGGSTITSYTATSYPEGLTGTVSQSGNGSITVTGLSSLTSYTFTITATNAYGTSQPSSNSNTITTPNGAPNAPTISSAVAGNGEATIYFNEPANDGGSTITSYTATSSPEGLTGTVSQSGDGTITIIGLTNGTSYTFTIAATNALGTSVASNVSQAVIPGNSIYDNLATTASGIDYGNKSKIGQQFLATGGGQLVQVEVNLFRTNNNASGAFTVELWSNNANSTGPLAKLATLNSSDWSNMPLNSIAPYSITSFTQNYTLVAGTYYWLVVSQSVNGPAAKQWAKNGSGLGQTAIFSGSWTNLGSSENFGARIKTIN